MNPFWWTLIFLFWSSFCFLMGCFWAGRWNQIRPDWSEDEENIGSETAVEAILDKSDIG